MGSGRGSGVGNPVGRWIQEATNGPRRRWIMGEEKKKRGASEGCFRKISYSVIQFFILFILSLFIYLERENVHVQGRDRERGRERIPISLNAVSAEPATGFDPTNWDIVI